MKYLAIIMTAGFLAIGYSDGERHKAEARTALHSSLELKSLECMKKAARYANAVDPRHYSDGTVKNVYRNCLKEL